MSSLTHSPRRRFMSGGSRFLTRPEIRVYTVQNDFRNPVEPDANTPADVYGLIDFEVQTWDGSQWVTVSGGAVAGNDRAMRVFTFPDITTTKIRVLFNNAATSVASSKSKLSAVQRNEHVVAGRDHCLPISIGRCQRSLLPPPV